jgi:hypothetical protein
MVRLCWECWRDRVYVPQVGYVTGDLDIHDVTVEADAD